MARPRTLRQSEDETRIATARWRWLVLCLLCVVGSVLTLLLTANPGQPVLQFFGLWRSRHVLLALALIWLGVMALCAMVGKRFVGRMLLASATVIVVLSTLELLGRSGSVDFDRWFRASRGRPLGFEPQPGIVCSGSAPQDLAMRWGLPFEEVEYRFRTDPRGFRNSTDVEVPDLVLLGDSFLVAGLTPDDELLSSQLSRRTGLTVSNVALLDVDVSDEFRLLTTCGVDVAGKRVLQFVFEGNDLAGPRRAAQEVMLRSFFRSVLPRLQALTEDGDPVARSHHGTIRGDPVYFLWDRQSMADCQSRWPVVAADLERTKDWVLGQGGRFGVVLIPSKLRVLGPLCTWPGNSSLRAFEAQLTDLPADLSDWCRRNGVPFLDLDPALREAAGRGELPWWPADTHWNGAGQRAAAEAIVEWSHGSGAALFLLERP